MPERRASAARPCAPLLGTPRSAILAYAREHELEWVEDESNADQALTRNFIRRSVGPLLEKKFPRWKESLGRAARISPGRKSAGRAAAPLPEVAGPQSAQRSEARRDAQTARRGGARTLLAHDGVKLRVYRGNSWSIRPGTRASPRSNGKASRA